MIRRRHPVASIIIKARVCDCRVCECARGVHEKVSPALKLLRSKWKPLFDVFEVMEEEDSLEIIKGYVSGKRFNWRRDLEGSLLFMLYFGVIEELKWLVSENEVDILCVSACALIYGYPMLLKWLHEQGGDLDKSVRCLRDTGLLTDGEPIAFCYLAMKLGYDDVAEWGKSNGYVWREEWRTTVKYTSSIMLGLWSANIHPIL